MELYEIIWRTAAKNAPRQNAFMRNIIIPEKGSGVKPKW